MQSTMMAPSAQRQTTPTSVVSLDPGQGDVETILLKFTFKNHRDVPLGIPLVDRRLDLAHQHQMEAADRGVPEAGEFGRVRTGHVDTGNHVVDNLGNVQVATLRRGFTNTGFLFAGAHYFVKRAKAKFEKDKYVVVLTFTRNTANIAEIGRATTEALRFLGNSIWAFCHVWQNVHQQNITINLAGLITDQGVVKHALVVRHRHLVIESVDVRLEEDKE